MHQQLMVYIMILDILLTYLINYDVYDLEIWYILHNNETSGEASKITQTMTEVNDPLIKNNKCQLKIQKSFWE